MVVSRLLAIFAKWRSSPATRIGSAFADTFADRAKAVVRAGVIWSSAPIEVVLRPAPP